MSLSIALTKGRLEKKTVEMLDQVGYGTQNLKTKGRTLVFEDTLKPVQYFLAKSNDVLTYVDHGVADIGIVGKDTLMERGSTAYELLDLEIGKCRFCVASLPEKKLLKKTGHIKIGTKYPRVAREYFLKQGIDVEVIKIEGSVELAPILGLADGIVDIVETGTTLKENGLVLLDTVCDISARVIVNKASYKLKREEVLQFVQDLESVVKLRADKNR